jgi:hypothetical protein
MLVRNLEPGSVVFFSRDDQLGICRFLRGLPGERTDVLPLSSTVLGEDWIDARISRKTGLKMPAFEVVRKMKGEMSWEMVAVPAFATENIGRVPAVYTDIKPATEFLRDDLAVTPAGMLWRIAPRSPQGIDLKYWDYPVQPESIPRAGRKARGHWSYVTAEGTTMKPELYEDRFFLPLLWARVRLADLYLPQDPAKAQSMYDSVLAVYPDAIQEPRFAYHRGLAFYQTGRRGDAARTWEELLAAKPPPEIETFADFYMGELHREAGRAAMAEGYYRKSRAAKPPPELQKALEERLPSH